MYLANKTTQAAAKFVQMAGGTLPYIVLLKLLYLADRQMVVRWGVPMTYDQWYAMKNGPVLSNTYNTIRLTPSVTATSVSDDYWVSHFRKDGYDLCLIGDPGDDLLSEAEDEIIAHVFDEHGRKNKWTLVDWTHELPEWNDPGNYSTPISYETVLLAEGFTPDAITEKINSIHAAREIASAFAGLTE